MNYLVLIITIPIFLILTIFNREILNIFGEEFRMGDTVLLVLGLSFLFNSLLGFSGQVLSIVGRSKFILFNTIGAGILNIILNYILIPRYGILGAAIGTGFSIFAVNIVRTIEIYILEDFSISYRSLIKPLIFGILIYSATLYCKQISDFQINLPYLILFSFLYLFCYCLLVWKLILDDEEKTLVYSLIENRSIFL